MNERRSDKYFIILLLSVFTLGFLTSKVLTSKVPESVSKTVYIPYKEVQTDTVYVDRIKKVKVPGKTEIEVDSTYYYKYLDEKDRASRLSIFIEAIKVSDTIMTLVDNEDIKIDVWTKNRGKMLAQSAEYKIKPKEVQVDIELPPPPVFQLFGGVSAGIPTKIGGDFTIGSDISLILKDPTLQYRLRFDNKENITIGISKRLIKF